MKCATLTLPTVKSEPGAGYLVNYTLEGFTSRYTRKATDRLAEGSQRAPVDPQQPWVVTVRVPVDNTETHAARLTYAFRRGDEVLAMDHLWINK